MTTHDDSDQIQNGAFESQILEVSRKCLVIYFHVLAFYDQSQITRILVILLFYGTIHLYRIVCGNDVSIGF